MISVFIGGSRRIGKMNPDLAHRLDNIIQKQFQVIIGDADGFDRVAQSYLADNGYQSVVVYCTAGVCRNNVGKWPIHTVEYHGKDRGLEFYTAKDNAMLKDAHFGLFAWEGKSKGTLRNIRIMAELGKPSAVYVSTTNKFITLRNTLDLSQLTSNEDSFPATAQGLFSDDWRGNGSVQKSA